MCIRDRPSGTLPPRLWHWLRKAANSRHTPRVPLAFTVPIVVPAIGNPMVLSIGSESREALVLVRARERDRAYDLSLLWPRSHRSAASKHPSLGNRICLGGRFHEPHLHVGLRYAPIAKSVRSGLNRLDAREDELRERPRNVEAWQAQGCAKPGACSRAPSECLACGRRCLLTLLACGRRCTLNLCVRPLRWWIIKHKLTAIDFWIWYLRLRRSDDQRTGKPGNVRTRRGARARAGAAGGGGKGGACWRCPCRN